MSNEVYFEEHDPLAASAVLGLIATSLRTLIPPEKLGVIRGRLALVGEEQWILQEARIRARHLDPGSNFQNSCATLWKAFLAGLDKTKHH